ncbi:MAG: acyl-CoA dehydrogenase family protein [Abditibacteriales bacterium]|nr:acyl-CoA dehydrogenase family protein [Abditibacteriales bacterium]
MFLTPEQQQIRDAIRAFAEERVKPGAAQRDVTGEFPFELLRELASLGFIGMTVAPDDGGAGADWVSYAIVMEELARADAALALMVGAMSLAITHINLYGTPEQKRRYLPDIIAGRRLCAWAFTEPGAGSDAAALRTRAVRDGDGWLLNGEKTFTTLGSVADVFVVMASTNLAKRRHGISAFLVEKDFPGVTRGKPMHKMGVRASDTSGVVLDNVRVPAYNLLGKEDEGYWNALHALELGRIGIGALAVGIAQAALEVSASYAKQRHTFGKPIAEHQFIQGYLADMATEIDAARLLVRRAAAMQDTGQRTRKESAMAKLFASEVALRAADKAVQIHGGYGYMQEFGVERLYRDAKVCTIGEGTSEVMRLVIAKELLK